MHGGKACGRPPGQRRVSGPLPQEAEREPARARGVPGRARAGRGRDRRRASLAGVGHVLAPPPRALPSLVSHAIAAAHMMRPTHCASEAAARLRARGGHANKQLVQSPAQHCAQGVLSAVQSPFICFFNGGVGRAVAALWHRPGRAYVLAERAIEGFHGLCVVPKSRPGMARGLPEQRQRLMRAASGAPLGPMP